MIATSPVHHADVTLQALAPLWLFPRANRATMIIVTGTKRSGTSMWMQLLHAGGFALIGEAFPRNWAETIKVANPKGFFESRLTAGIHHETNPSPATGAYLFPKQVRSHAVKVFIPGLIRTELGFIDRCIATIRPWQEYAASMAKLQAIGKSAEDLDESRREPPSLPFALEWWGEYYSLIRDLATRRYPFHFQSYRQLVADPERVLVEVFGWLGDGDVSAAARAVDPALHRNHTLDHHEGAPDLPPGCLEAFDTLYDTIDRGQALTPQLVAWLNDVQQSLRPMFLENRAAVQKHFVYRLFEAEPA